MSNSTRLDRQVTQGAVAASGKRWCVSCFTFHPADIMVPFKQPNGSVIYRCPRWIEARRRHKEQTCPAT
jgi:hypothetical protein